MRAFGVTADGYAIQAAPLVWPGGLEVEILEYGAIVHRLDFPTPTGLRSAILSRDTLEAYERDDAYVGALVGRFANRIAEGRFPLDGAEVQVSVNEPPNTLHGGRVGFNKRVWRFEPGAEDGCSLSLTYRSPDGEEGFPGEVELRATFSVTAADTLQIDYEASTDAATAVNLSHHLYFNLLGDINTDILTHTLEIAADTFTPVGRGLIPTGEISPVGGTPFDLRRGQRLDEVLGRSDPLLAMADGVDMNWALDPSADYALKLQAPDGATLHISTNQPGMQVYSGQKLKPPFVPHGALAIEPQGFPDAVNHRGFPNAILRPGETYRRRSTYRLGL